MAFRPWFVSQCGILACKEAISLICYTYTHRHDTFPYYKHEKENFRHLGYNWHSMDHTVSSLWAPRPTTEQQWKGWNYRAQHYKIAQQNVKKFWTYKLNQVPWIQSNPINVIVRVPWYTLYLDVNLNNGKTIYLIQYNY